MTKTEGLSIEGLKVYKKQNPSKFKQKFGDIDLDSIPSDFNLNLYRYQVAQHRINLERRGISQEVVITPDTFKEKVIEPIEEVEENESEDEDEDEAVEVEKPTKVKNVKGGDTLKTKTKK